MQAILADLSEDVRSTTNNSLVLAIVWAILNVYCKQNTPPLVIAQYASNRRSTWQHYDLIQTVLLRVTRQDYHHFLLGSATDHHNEEFVNSTIVNAETAIWFVDGLESYYALEEDLLAPDSFYRRNGYFTLIYTGAGSQMLENIKVIYRRFFHMYVTNINVIVQIRKVTFAYTYYPFRPNKCHSAQPQLHISFRGISERLDFNITKHFFPSKVSNMHGCELAVITWHYPPFIFLERDTDGNTVTRVHGIEGLLLNGLAKSMNFTTRIVEPESRDRGAIFDNGTTTGITRMIVDGEANLTIIFFMIEKRRSMFMLPSMSYMSFPLVMAIPRGSMLSPMERLLRPFRYIIWSCLGGSVILGVLVIYALKLLGSTHIMAFVFGANTRFPASNFWSTLYGASIHGNLPHRNFARYLLALWLLYSFVLRTAYTGQLFLILQDARALTTLQRLQEIVDHNYTIYTVPVLINLLDGSIGKTHIEFVDGEQNTMPNILNRIAMHNTKEVLTIIEPALQRYNDEQTIPERRLAALPEKLINAPLALYMRRHSYLHKQIDNVLLHMLAAGIVSKFERRYINNFKVPPQGTNEPTKLTLWLLLGIFSLYLALLGGCTLVFLLELWTRCSPLTKCVIDFFNY